MGNLAAGGFKIGYAANAMPVRLAVERADEIFSVPGIDAIFVGPNDLAASMRGKDGKPPSGEATTQANKHILATCKKHGVAAGYHCSTPEEVRARIEEGAERIVEVELNSSERTAFEKSAASSHAMFPKTQSLPLQESAPFLSATPALSLDHNLQKVCASVELGI